ncbi:MAG: alanine racemase, partial [Desulfitobacteriaceae bacterium]|nr:alanine racemase [Desulfitobacteriaceae bacterium]
RLVSPVVKIMAVVKSDAYGHGAVEVARVLEETGADMLAVTTVEEGRELVQNGIELPVLVFAPLLSCQAKTVLDYGLVPTIDSLAALEALARQARAQGIKAAFHLKVETGMGRSGIMPEEVGSFIKSIKSLPSLSLQGIYSHLATAMAERKEHAQKQYQVFCQVLDMFRKEKCPFEISHIANSAALLDLREMELDMVRVGTLLYGQYPSPYVKRKLDLKDPWKVKARVLSVKKLPAGSPVGYGRDYIAKKPLEVGVVAIGYADGFGQQPHTRPVKTYDLIKSTAKGLTQLARLVPVNFVRWQNKKIPVVGRIAMQLCMVDASGHNIKVGDEVSVPLRRTSAGARLPRIFFRDGSAVMVRDINGALLKCTTKFSKFE